MPCGILSNVPHSCVGDMLYAYFNNSLDSTDEQPWKQNAKKVQRPHIGQNKTVVTYLEYRQQIKPVA